MNMNIYICYVLSLVFSHVLPLYPGCSCNLETRSWNEDGNPKTDWAAAATRAGNRVLAENQARQWDAVKGAVAATGG